MGRETRELQFCALLKEIMERCTYAKYSFRDYSSTAMSDCHMLGLVIIQNSFVSTIIRSIIHYFNIFLHTVSFPYNPASDEVPAHRKIPLIRSEHTLSLMG